MKDYTLEERADKIIAACGEAEGTSPYRIFVETANEDFVRIHGPEHHVLDGACVLAALHNAGMDFDLKRALKQLKEQGLKMPGAACGKWGVCGAVASVGAALAIIEETGPLTTDDSWGSHMVFTSRALGRLAEIGGPRCCKRDAYLAFKTLIPYAEERFGVRLQDDDIHCGFSDQNAQCLGEKCPFHQS